MCLLLLPAGLLADEQCDIKLLKKAEELCSATLYREAVPLFLQIQTDSLKVDACEGLGKALFYDGQYAEALVSLKDVPKDILTEKVLIENRLFTALCHRHLGQYEDVVEVLSKTPSADINDECLFELGMAHFFLEHWEQAFSCFYRINTFTANPTLYFLSNLYLVRLELKKGNYKEASDRLNSLSATPEKALAKEFLFLKGEAAYYNKDYRSAVAFYQQALPEQVTNCSWYRDTLYNLGWANLKLAEDINMPVSDRKMFLFKASEIFQQLAATDSNEHEVIALAYSYLIRANLLGDSLAYIEAESILSGFPFDSSDEGAFYAQLIKAEASDCYEVKESAYKNLIDSFRSNTQQTAKIWYMRAVNNFEEAQKLKSPAQFANAALYFEKAYEISDSKTSPQALGCLKFQAQSLWEIGTKNARIEALNVLEEAFKICPESKEFDELYGAYAVHLIEENTSERILQRVETTLKERSALDGACAPILALAAFYFKSGKYNDAYKQYLSFVERYSDSPLIPQVRLQSTLALERFSTNQETLRSIRQKIYEDYPESEWAPIAYFISYAYQDYLQGDRQAVKHLEGFKDRFPESPLLINAYYLLGLDLKRDRKTPEGKWVRKKSSIKSLEAFAELESTFDRLFKDGKIPVEEQEYYINMRYRAILEKGLIHYEVAKASNAAKRDIYSQYAIDTFQELRKELETPQHPLLSMIIKNKHFFSLHEECLYWLAMTFLHSEDEIAAQHVFDDMHERYKEASVTAGYYLSRIHYEQGVIAAKNNNSIDALRYFLKAEEASKGKYLSVDEKLDLWLCQSQCYEAIDQNENAMLTLSKVINDDSISHLRVKAMFMRAILYEKMGRPELARRQLEFVAKMDGDWSKRAKIKLDKDYATP